MVQRGEFVGQRPVAGDEPGVAHGGSFYIQFRGLGANEKVLKQISEMNSR